MILLLTYNFHSILESLDLQGLQFTKYYQELKDSKYVTDIQNYQTFAGICTLPIFTAISYWLEILAATRFNRVVLYFLIVVNLVSLLTFAIVFSYKVKIAAGMGAYFMLYTSVTFFKLLSFHHVYHDIRYLVKRVIQIKKVGGEMSLEPNMIEGTILGVNKKDFDEALTYPKCLTLR